MTNLALIGLTVCWMGWLCPFLIRARHGWDRKSAVTVSSSNWGFLLQSIAYSIVWFPSARQISIWQYTASMTIALSSIACAWLAVGHLGKQWRIRAGLYHDHELVRSGPYRIVRHPIYASMLGMFMATGLLRSTWAPLLIGLLLFLAGTEIRVRAEEKLLAERFGETFRSYKAGVQAYVPYLR